MRFFSLASVNEVPIFEGVSVGLLSIGPVTNFRKHSRAEVCERAEIRQKNMVKNQKCSKISLVEYFSIGSSIFLSSLRGKTEITCFLDALY